MRTGKRGGAGGVPRAKKQAPALRLLPSVCRDCGRNEQEVALSPYLDFRLCEGCIRQREREVFNSLRPKKASASKGRETPSKKTKGPAGSRKPPRR